jgi:hypothetical protein
VFGSSIAKLLVVCLLLCRAPEGGITRLEFLTDSIRVDPITCGHGGTVHPMTDDGSTSDDNTDKPHVDSELCETLTQGQAPQGSFEISSKGPR